MIRMVLIYAALFAIAGGAIWMKPATDGAGYATLKDEDFQNLTHLVLNDLNATPPSVRENVQVSRALASSQRPMQRPARPGVNPDLSAQVLAQLEIANGTRQAVVAAPDARSSREIASLISRALSEDATGAEIERIMRGGDGAVDLEDLLETPGSVEGSSGARFLASALIRPAITSTNDQSLNNIGNVVTLSGSTDPAAEPRYYVVQAGDSLGSIADEFYGSPSAFRDIFDANRDKLASIDSIRVGQRLRLP